MGRFPRKQLVCLVCGRALRSTVFQEKEVCFSCDESTDSVGVPVSATNHKF